MPKITPRGKDSDTIVVKTNSTKAQSGSRAFSWWKARSQAELCNQVLDTASFLKTQQQFRHRQAAIHAKLYGNQPLFGIAGSNINKISQSTAGLPMDRPTMNVIQSCVDTKVSRITQSRPRPIFLTDNSDYKERNLAKQMNSFIAGELYQTKAYELAENWLRDADVLGTGCLKVFKTSDQRVGIERRLLTELYVDPNDAIYGDPRQLLELKLVDRSVAEAMFSGEKSKVIGAEQAYPDSGDDEKTASDQIMLVEAWHLPSGKDAGDGRHAIACTNGVLLDEEWKRPNFPFVFLHSTSRLLGFWGQGACERLMGTQVEINKLLMTISRSINLVGVPRVFVEMGSKVVKAQINNDVGAIITYQGTKPIYEVAPCMPQEIYAQLQRLVEYAYQQEGVSQLSAQSQKPAGLNSGEAIRNYNDIQTDRFAALAKRYDMGFVALAYQIIDTAIEIAEDEGSYQTVYPNKDGTREINLPEIKKLKENPFVIQCFDASSLPREPAGRLQKVTEMMQAGIISPAEGRRLLDYPDIEQVDKLANASEERILKILDAIVETGEYTPPDPFMDLGKAQELVTQYYNLYASAKLEEEKQQKLRDFSTQIQALKQAAMPPPPPAGAPGQPMASPEAMPTNPMIPNVPLPAA